MSISKILFELRSEQGISQKQLAEAIGVSQSTIAKIEVNRNEATASTVRKLAKYFQVSADYLLGLEDEFGAKAEGPGPKGENRYERELLKCFRSLPPEFQPMAVETLRLWAGCQSGAESAETRNGEEPHGNNMQK